jgi:hypothetical protein
MAESRIEALVLSDAEGNLYEIPYDELLAYRVSSERLTVLERVLAGDEVAGYALSAFLHLKGQQQGPTAEGDTEGSQSLLPFEIPPGPPVLPFGGAIFQVPPVA